MGDELIRGLEWSQLIKEKKKKKKKKEFLQLGKKENRSRTKSKE